MREVELLVQAAGLVKHLHEDRKNSTGIPSLEVLSYPTDVLLEMLQDVHSGTQSG